MDYEKLLLACMQKPLKDIAGCCGPPQKMIIKHERQSLFRLKRPGATCLIIRRSWALPHRRTAKSAESYSRKKITASWLPHWGS